MHSNQSHRRETWLPGASSASSPQRACLQGRHDLLLSAYFAACTRSKLTSLRIEFSMASWGEQLRTSEGSTPLAALKHAPSLQVLCQPCLLLFSQLQV